MAVAYKATWDDDFKEVLQHMHRICGFRFWLLMIAVIMLASLAALSLIYLIHDSAKSSQQNRLIQTEMSYQESKTELCAEIQTLRIARDQLVQNNTEASNSRKQIERFVSACEQETPGLAG